MSSPSSTTPCTHPSARALPGHLNSSALTSSMSQPTAHQAPPLQVPWCLPCQPPWTDTNFPFSAQHPPQAPGQPTQRAGMRLHPIVHNPTPHSSAMLCGQHAANAAPVGAPAACGAGRYCLAMCSPHACGGPFSIVSSSSAPAQPSEHCRAPRAHAAPFPPRVPLPGQARHCLTTAQETLQTQQAQACSPQGPERGHLVHGSLPGVAQQLEGLQQTAPPQTALCLRALQRVRPDQRAPTQQAPRRGSRQEGLRRRALRQGLQRLPEARCRRAALRWRGRLPRTPGTGWVA